MSPIREAFEARRMHGQGTLICYLTAGYPDAETFRRCFQACVEGGADIMEVGVPFSDPVADGPTIQATSQEALALGVTPRTAIELAGEAKSLCPVPTLLMGYYNPIFRMGEGRFSRLTSDAGLDGLIVADLPLEESGGLRSHCQRRGLDLVQIIAPTTSTERMARIASASHGMVYLVGALGTTGARSSLDRGLGELVGRARRSSGDMPLAVGFGISDGRQARSVLAFGADGVIVGSAILSRLMHGGGDGGVRSLVSGLRAACSGDER